MLARLTSLFLLMLLTACSSSGGGDGGDTPPPPPPAYTVSVGTPAAVTTASCDDSSVALFKLRNAAQAKVMANNLRIHYQRTGADYTGWGLHVWNSVGTAADTTGIEWATPKQASGTDRFGQYYDISLIEATGTIGYIFHKENEKDHGGSDQLFALDGTAEIWRRQGDSNTYRSNPDDIPVADVEFVRVHYKRYNADYSGFGLHIWEISNGADIDSARLPSGVVIGDWANAIPFANPMLSGTDAFGVWVDVPVKKYSAGARGFNFLVHKGTDDAGKDGGDRSMQLAQGSEVWLVQDDNVVYYSEPKGDISTQRARAYWITENTLLWPRVNDTGRFSLYYSSQGGLTVGDQVNNSSGEIPLTVINSNDLSMELRDQYRFVASPYVVLKLPADLGADNLKNLLRTQTALVHRDPSGVIYDATTAQLPGVLDSVYANTAKNASLGVKFNGSSVNFSVWAPTAVQVALCTYSQGNGGSANAVNVMQRDATTGVWTFSGNESIKGQYYRYLVDVVRPESGTIVRHSTTDPYSVSLSANSQRSWIGELSQNDVKPLGWDGETRPSVAAPEDLSIYEVHVRDFSAKDSSVDVTQRGKYRAFTHTSSAGMLHLQSLRDAGLNLIHFLPINDIATINETTCSETVIPTAAADSEEQQAAVHANRDNDCFNWGYDPWHYTAIEGSYASDPSDARVRVKEFREAIQSLHEMNLQVALDVVYNHTPAAGIDNKSVLDKIVPGYYHRLDSIGRITNSTCCANTATEHAMMEKLMVDSVVTLAREYHIDAFRFDIMGHQPLDAMLRLQTAVNTATGRSIYLYGEGWNFGEVANDARFMQARQSNLGGSGIGSFNDRIRDALRGGGAFDGGNDLIRNQGIANGLYVHDNGSGGGKTRNDWLWSADITRLGLAATQKDYLMQTANDANTLGQNVDYYGIGAGYTLDPQETINYADKHDNQTLYDMNTYRLPLSDTLADRVRAQNLAVAFITLAQGIPFYHAGMDILRSKSFDRDSYNSGDHFNAIDWSLVSNNYGIGAPVAEKNQDNWPMIKPRLADVTLKPDAAAAQAMHQRFKEMLQIRNSSTLFRLRTGADVKSRLSMLNTGSAQQAGVIAWQLNGVDYAGANYNKIVVIANSDNDAQTITLPTLQSLTLQLHPIQANGGDAVVKTATFNSSNGGIFVPGRTVAVWVQ